jgi:caa(3)-type oxidase subunit IV
MGHFSDYEADQSRLYNIGHVEDINSEKSKAKVKGIWKITGILTVITIIEVGLGLSLADKMGDYRWVLNLAFIILTIAKALFIVSNFMHLGDENKGMKLMIYVPLTLFIWFIIAFLADGSWWLEISQALGYSHPS